MKTSLENLLRKKVKIFDTKRNPIMVTPEFRITINRETVDGIQATIRHEYDDSGVDVFIKGNDIDIL